MADEQAIPSRERPATAYASAIAFWGALCVLGAAIVIAGGWAWSSRPARTRDASPSVVTQRVLPSPPPAADAAPSPRTLVAPPAVAEPAARTEASAKAPDEPLRTILDLNTATAAELELLPGVGPALAARIIEHRTRIGSFRRVDDLDKVRGIGAKTLARIKPHVKVAVP